MVFEKRHLCGLNILYLTELAIIFLEIFMMGLLLLQASHNRCCINLPKNYSHMTIDNGI